MKVLFLKSATSPLIVSLVDVQEKVLTVLDETVVEMNNQFLASTELFHAIDEILLNNDMQYDDIARIYVASGPGSYTAARLLVTIVKTITFLVPQVEVYDASILDVFLEMSRDVDNNGLNKYGIVYARKNKYYVLDEVAGVLGKDELLSTADVESIIGETECIVNGLHITEGKFDIMNLPEILNLSAWERVSSVVTDISVYEPYYLEAVNIG